MVTRSKASKKVVLGEPMNSQVLREHESLDSGVVCDEPEENHRPKNLKKNPLQLTQSRSRKNLPDVEKENDESLANSRQNNQQANKSSTKKIKVTKKSSKLPSEIASSTEVELAAEDELKLSQCSSDYDWKERLKWLHSRRDVGLWIQCCRENCRKWRFNEAIHDPVDVQEIWYCDMQLDPRIANCDYPQQKIPPHLSEDLIENKYNAGSIVWARINGYPWWPGMVDDCPSTFRYYELPKDSNVPIKYNVTFFEEGKVLYNWIAERNLRPYKWNPKDIFLQGKRMTFRGISYKNEVLRACEMADEAQQLSIYERLERFSFVARFIDNSETTITKRSNGAHNRTRPVMLKTNVLTQKKMLDDNFTMPNQSFAHQTASNSKIYSQTCVTSEKEVEMPPKVASNNKSQRIQQISNDELSTRKNDSDSGFYPQTDVQIQKGIEKPSKIASDNKSSRSLKVSYDETSIQRNALGIHKQTSVKSRQKENERPSQVISNIPSSSRVKNVTCDELSTRKNASASGFYPQTDVQIQKGIEKPSEIASGNKSSRSLKVSYDETSNQRNARGIHKQTSVKSRQKVNERPSQVISNISSSSRVKKVSCDELSTRKNASTSGFCPQTDVEIQNSIEKLSQVVAKNQSSRSKKVTFDESSTQGSFSVFGVNQQTNVRNGIERLSKNVSDNRSSRIEKVSKDKLSIIQCPETPVFHQDVVMETDDEDDRPVFEDLDVILKRLRCHKSKKVSFDESSIQGSSSLFGVHQQNSAENIRGIKRTSRLLLENQSPKIQKFSKDELFTIQRNFIPQVVFNKNFAMKKNDEDNISISGDLDEPFKRLTLYKIESP